jgi:hypothetical protein
MTMKTFGFNCGILLLCLTAPTVVRAQLVRGLSTDYKVITTVVDDIPTFSFNAGVMLDSNPLNNFNLTSTTGLKLKSDKLGFVSVTADLPIAPGFTSNSYQFLQISPTQLRSYNEYLAFNQTELLACLKFLDISGLRKVKVVIGRSHDRFTNSTTNIYTRLDDVLVRNIFGLRGGIVNTRDYFSSTYYDATPELSDGEETLSDETGEFSITGIPVSPAGITMQNTYVVAQFRAKMPFVGLNWKRYYNVEYGHSGNVSPHSSLRTRRMVTYYADMFFSGSMTMDNIRATGLTGGAKDYNLYHNGSNGLSFKDSGFRFGITRTELGRKRVGFEINAEIGMKPRIAEIANLNQSFGYQAYGQARIALVFISKDGFTP